MGEKVFLTASVTEFFFVMENLDGESSQGKELRKQSIQGHNTEKTPGLGLGRISKF